MSSVADFLAGSDDPEIADELPPESPLGVPTDRVVTVPEDSSEQRPRCQEPDCDKGCRKRRNSEEFFPYCAKHNAIHSGSSLASPKSQTYQQLEEQRKRSAKDIENAIIGWFQPVQVSLMASGDVYCATAIGHEVPPLALSIGDLSTEFPWLQRGVNVVDKWTALSQVAFHIVKLGAMIGVHHEWIPYEGAIRFLVPPPESVRMSPNGQQSFSPDGASFT